MANSSAINRESDLPTPLELPQAEVLIFDGECRFCLASIKQVRWLDGKDRLAYVSLHDPLVAERYSDLDHDAMMAQMYLIDRDGNRHGGADALKVLSRRLPKLWLLAPLMHIPFTMPIWRWLYAFVAKRRYFIAGRIAKAQGESCESTCSLHFDK